MTVTELSLLFCRIKAEEPKEVIFMEILKVENLTKIYGAGNAEVRALDGVSFTVAHRTHQRGDGTCEE